MGSFQSRDVSRPIADREKYLIDYIHIHNKSSYLIGYGVYKWRKSQETKQKKRKKIRNQQDDFELTFKNWNFYKMENSNVGTF